jgi:hypothetical protein
LGIFQRIEQCLAGGFKRSIYSKGATISIETIAMIFKRAKIVACEARPNYVLWVRFDDGIEGEVNLSDLVGQGVFQAWESEEFWKSVKVDPESDTVCWGEEIDLDPYALKQDVLDSQKSRSPPKDSKPSPPSKE